MLVNCNDNSKDTGTYTTTTSDEAYVCDGLDADAVEEFVGDIEIAEYPSVLDYIVAIADVTMAAAAIGFLYKLIKK